MRKILGFFTILCLTAQVSFASIIDTNHIYGLTLDAVNALAKIDTSLARLCKKPTARIVFDEFVAATYYQTPVNEISKFAFVMGEILDSYYMPQYTLQQYTDRMNEYMNLLGSKVNIWEVGNEINGEWLGTTSDVVAKINAAYNIVKANNKKAALTLYYNKNCWENPANEMFRWVNTNINSTIKNNIDYILVSYYEDDCNNYQPNWQQVFDSLHVIFPNSKLGMGECGTTKTAQKASFINRYYKMNITTPNYIGGYFWWYYKQDCVPQTDTLWTVFNNAISNYASPTTQSSQLTYIPLNNTSLTLNWTNGNGSKRVVFFRDSVLGNPVISDGITYNANATYGLGTSDGTGWYCVYNGTGSNVTVSGLTSGKSYRAFVLEYNGFSGFEGYNRATSVMNPVLIQGPLPVELVSFSSFVSKNDVRLKWITANEINNKGFSIERKLSANNENWISTGFINGNGNSNVPINYEYVDRNLSSGKYNYRLKQIDYNGNFEYHNLLGDVIVGAPSKFELSQNYPNPFNPTTNINFGLPADSRVSIKVFDISGREVKTLLNESRTAGYYTIAFDASNISSGVYFYKIEADKFSDVKRMLLVK